MNKTKIKNFSIWARKKLIEVITYKAGRIGITENGIAEPLPESKPDMLLFDIGTKEPEAVKGKKISNRKKFVNAILEKAKDCEDYKTAYENVIEEIAYTWFNRLIAIRFMEVNDYLPSQVRVISSESGKSEPDIVTYAESVASGEGFNITADEIYGLKKENKLDSLFRKMFLEQCNKLHELLPELFESTVNDFSEMLLPISFIDEDGVIRHLVNDIDEDDFNIEKQGQIEIIGWLYQYYNTEPKDKVFEGLKKNIKITKENIPAATQLFTPDWIVRYMVENSLGRTWLESHRESEIKKEMIYFLDEAEQEEDVKEKLEEMRSQNRVNDPTEIKFIDPCMGSGHILVYAFDVFMMMYLEQGYTEREAAKNIITKNLFGLDIDKRAYQLTYFALLMKARQYNRRILDGETKPNIAHFQGVSNINTMTLDGAIKELVLQFENADIYGSLIEVSQIDGLDEALDNFSGTLDLDIVRLEQIMTIYKIVSQKYDVVCTNPPYMGGGGMSTILSDFVKKKYADSKSDLFACFIEKCGVLAKENGYYAMITQHAWMFLSSYEKLREKLIKKTTVNMAHLGARAFNEIGGEVVQTTAFVNINSQINGYSGTYSRLVDVNGENEKRELFLSKEKLMTSKQENFSKIPGMPVAYWVSKKFVEAFENGISIDEISDFTGSQHKTADNEKYLRLWWEINEDHILKKIWIFYAKGGEYRKWYGNNDLIIDWSKDAIDFYKKNKTSNMIKERYCFKEGITYTSLTSSVNGFRYLPPYGAFDIKGPSIVDVELRNYCLGFLNTCISNYILKLLNPTITLQVKDVKNDPIIIDVNSKSIIESFVQQNISISKNDWDSFETSWDYIKHPLLKNTFTISEAYDIWNTECETRFNTLKSNEEELNRIFIDIYGLQGELTPEVEDKNVTVRRADLQREIKSLISYSVGCMFGRYSLDCDGLAYAGGDWNTDKYKSFTPVPDNVIPITDDDYFSDDIVSRFVQFIETVYGKDTLEKNLEFVAYALGTKGNTAREKIRTYFLNGFFTDHCKIYQKRPIYWLFDSGKQNGFKALVYMHRWNADTVGKVRADYLHRLQRVYLNETERMKSVIEDGSDSRETAKAYKRQEKLTKQLKETTDYDALIEHIALAKIDIDLDDGVKVNYEKVQTDRNGKKHSILAKI